MDVALLVVLLALAWIAALGLGLALIRAAGRSDRPPELRPPAPLDLPPAARRLLHSGYGGLLLDRLALHTCRMLGVEQAVVLLRDEADPRIVIPVAGRGVDEELVGSRLAADQAYIGAWVPIVFGGAERGALLVSPGGRVDAAGLELLEHLAGVAASLLADAPLRAGLEPAMEGGIRALEAVLTVADPRTAAHSGEVAALAREVGERIGMDGAALIELEIAARVAEIGRVAQIGRRWPRRDSQLGAELIGRVPGLEVVAIVVRHIDERWDGQGFPDGLAYERIPLASRILAACEGYSRLTSEGPSGAAVSWEEALWRLNVGAGSRFDQDVLDAVEATVRAAAVR